MIKKIKIVSFAIFQAVLMFFIGLIAGIFYSVGKLLYDLFITMGWITSSISQGLSSGTALAFLALIGMPIIFAVFGFILGLVEGSLYNMLTKSFSRLKIDFINEK